MNAPIVAAEGVEVRFRGSPEPAVADSNLAICAGQSVGIVGESGSGKTTLGRALVGLVVPTRGQVLVEGRPWSAIRRRDELRRRVQMVFQDPYTSLNPGLTARETVAEVFRVWENSERTMAAKQAEQLLGEVGLARDAWDRKAAKLSGGQCQRVGIARALACSPRVLVADEPTSSLDVSVQAQILNLLIELRATHNLALVLISHDLAVVRYVTERSIVMYEGRIVEQAPTDQLFEHPAHPYTRTLVDSIPGRYGAIQLARNEVASSGCAFAPRCSVIGPGCLEQQPVLPDGHARSAACYHPLQTVDSPRPSMSMDEAQ